VSRITRNKLELRPERVELAKVVDGAVETCRPLLASSGHELTVALPPDPVYLDADFTRLAQVFSNLLNNAAKFSEPGGRIALAAERRGSEVVVSVRDGGIGIPREMLPHIFDMFTQADRSLERSRGGLGIGLTLVKRLVDMHGGSVEARSPGPGQGSEFLVRLPLAISGPRPGPPPPDDHPPPAAPARRRVLVADDNKDAAASLSVMLRILGYETCTAYDGAEALEAAARFRPAVALLDIGMPKTNGYEVARRIRQEPWGKDMVLLAVTGWGQAEDKQRTREAGFDHHLVKPVDPTALAQLLASVAAGGSAG
jgi:CheY-like chemotaxis protein/two-component sensor histidine kinase